MSEPSLTTAPIADLLESLYVEAARSGAAFHERMRSQSQVDSPPMDSREFFAQAKDVHLAVRRPTATLLYILARTHVAKTVVEFGTSFGISTLCLAAAVRDNGGQVVIGTEYEPGKVAATRQTMAAAGLDDLVEIREGDARETLSRDLPDTVDLLFLDGAKEMYVDVLQLVRPRLQPGALVIADNSSRGEGYLDHVRTSGGYLSVGLDDDVELSWVI